MAPSHGRLHEFERVHLPIYGGWTTFEFQQRELARTMIFKRKHTMREREREKRQRFAIKRPNDNIDETTGPCWPITRFHFVYYPNDLYCWFPVGGSENFFKNGNWSRTYFHCCIMCDYFNGKFSRVSRSRQSVTRGFPVDAPIFTPEKRALILQLIYDSVSWSQENNGALNGWQKLHMRVPPGRPTDCCLKTNDDYVDILGSDDRSLFRFCCPAQDVKHKPS